MKETMKRWISMALLCAVLATGLCLPASAASFRDVPKGYWAEDAIVRCAELGFFQGKSATEFGVGQPMSRGAFAVVLTRFFGWEQAENTALPFTDVPADAWYGPALATALQHGAVTTQSPAFRPNDPITREELAVALVRGLGYAPLSGMAQQLDIPFTDVATNKGYITMALDLGLVNGTSETTFSPEKTATREQVAVILMRLHDKLRGTETENVGLVRELKALPDLSKLDVVILGHGELQGGSRPRVKGVHGGADVRTVREASNGGKVLLYVGGTAASLRELDAAAAAAAINLDRANGGYDGVFLDIRGLKTAEEGRALTELTDALGGMLTGKLLYVTADAPCISGHSPEAYNYEVLGRLADRVVLRVHSHMEEIQEMAVAPVEPLEEIYFALQTLEKEMDLRKAALWLSTDATVWDGTQQVSSMTGLEVDALLAQEGTESSYSQRYGCSYLTGKLKNQDVTVWYPDGRSTQARAQLGRLFDANSVVLGGMDEMSPSLLEGLR